MKRGLAVAVALGVLAQPAAAADPRGLFAVKGVGVATCAEFDRALAQRTPQLGQMLSWIAGYLSAANRYEPATFDLISWQEEVYVLASMRGYCAKNPRAPLAQMTRAMVRSLGPTRIARSNAMQTIAAGGRSLKLYGDVVIRAKTRLARLGLYAGPRDATAGAAFLTAIAAYQRRERLPITGLPDQETLYRLLLTR